MASAYIYFGKPMTPDTGTSLVQAARSLMGEQDPPGQFRWDALHISFASGGGDMIAAMGAFNEIKRLPLRISTHNSGAVDSAIILPFMLGEERTASPASSFFFHQIHSQGNLQTTLVNETTKLMAHYTETVATIVSDRSKLSKQTVMNMMRHGTLVTPEDALDVGLIHQIAEPSLPQNARSWQV